MPRFEFRTDEELAERLKKAAELSKIPAAQIVKKGTNREIDRLARKHPELKREAA